MNANEPLLSSRGDQHAIACVDESPVEPSGAGCFRAVLNVQQPFIRPELAMKPHGVIDACHLHVGLREAHRVGEHRGIEQRPV